MFTKENAKELGAKGQMARMLFTSPEKRRYIAKKNAMRRWYKPKDDDLDRIECLLRFLANEVVEALLENDHRAAVHTATSMLGWERLKITLKASGMKNVTPEISADLEGRLEKARERREKALVGESAAVDTTATKDPLT